MKRSKLNLSLMILTGGAVCCMMFLLGRGQLNVAGWERLKASLMPSQEKPKDKLTDAEQEAEEKAAEVTSEEDPLNKRIRDELRDLVLDIAEGNVRKDQAIMVFDSDAEYHAFLKAIKNSGLSLLNSNAALRTSLVKYPSLAEIKDFLKSNPEISPELTANPLLEAPTPLQAKDLANSGTLGYDSQAAVKSALGMTKTSGKGVIMAVLDSAVADLPIFNNLVRSPSIVGDPTTDLSHGTEVASVFQQYAPDATIHSYPVVASDGFSDAFSIASAITLAVNNGAHIINVSLGSYNENPTLQQAVEYAKSRGTVIVASAGNGGADGGYTNSTYPARYAGVVAALATDGTKQTAPFSNESTNLGLSLPGVGVPAYTSTGESRYVDGTSFSSPLMGAVLANVMSDYGITGNQALPLIQTTADDGGKAGADPSFGYGTPNLGDIANLSNPTYTDGRVVSNYYNKNNGNGASVDYVVQNNGNMPLSDWTLNVNTNGNSDTIKVPSLAPNQSWSYSVPLQFTSGQTMSFSSEIRPPAGVTEANTTNNGMRSTLTQVGK